MDKLIFAKPTIEESTPTNNIENSWKIIISDDEHQVHEVTKLALSDFSFAGRKLEFISAYTEKETIQAITNHPDTANFTSRCCYGN